MYQHCQNPFAIKQRRKIVGLSPKPCFWASKQLFAIHFFLATCNVCPLTIPEFFSQTRVSDYWQLIHSFRPLFSIEPLIIKVASLPFQSSTVYPRYRKALAIDLVPVQLEVLHR